MLHRCVLDLVAVGTPVQRAAPLSPLRWWHHPGGRLSSLCGMTSPSVVTSQLRILPRCGGKQAAAPGLAAWLAGPARAAAGPPGCDLPISARSWLSERALHACRKFRAVTSTANFGRHSRAGLKSFPGARARVLGKKSTNPAEFCIQHPVAAGCCHSELISEVTARNFLHACNARSLSQDPVPTSDR